MAYDLAVDVSAKNLNQYADKGPFNEELNCFLDNADARVEKGLKDLLFERHVAAAHAPCIPGKTQPQARVRQHPPQRNINRLAATRLIGRFQPPPPTRGWHGVAVLIASAPTMVGSSD